MPAVFLYNRIHVSKHADFATVAEAETIFSESMEEIDKVLKERRKNWKPREPKYKKGVLRLFSEHAACVLW